MTNQVGLFKQIVTGSDNKTVDPTMAMVIFAVFVLLPSAFGVMSALSFIDVYFNKHEFNPTTFGSGGGILLAGFGVQILALVKLLRTDRQVSDGLEQPPNG